MIFLDRFPDIEIDKKAGTLRENIEKVIEEGIYSGYLPPGLKLNEVQIAKKLGISRTPVRESLLRLESKGLVKIIPNKGTIINDYSVDEIEEIYIIFGALAGTAASLSIEFITEDELVKMENYLIKMEESKDAKEWYIYNKEFHSTFLKPCRKKMLLNLIKNYTKQVSRYYYILFSNPQNKESAYKQHRDILNFFKSRNSKMVRETVEDHIKSVGEIIITALKYRTYLQSNSS